MKQTKLFAFLNFKSDGYDLVKTNLYSIKTKSSPEDPIAKIAVGLTKNTEPQDNVKIHIGD